MKVKLLAAAATAAALFAAGSASAQIMPGQLYGNLGYTHIMADIEDEGVDFGAVTGRFGANLTPNLGVEAEASFGVRDYEESGGGFTASLGLNNSLAAFAVARAPLAPNADIFARIGYGRAELELEVTGPGLNESASEGEDVLAFGAGGQYFFDGLNGVRAEFTRYDFQDEGGEVDSLSISFVRRF